VVPPGSGGLATTTFPSAVLAPPKATTKATYGESGAYQISSLWTPPKKTAAVSVHFLGRRCPSGRPATPRPALLKLEESVLNYNPWPGSLVNVGERHLRLLRKIQHERFFALSDVADVPGADKLVRNLTSRGLLRPAGRMPIKGCPKVWACTDMGRLLVSVRDQAVAA
jgi:hypothetical protein